MRVLKKVGAALAFMATLAFAAGLGSRVVRRLGLSETPTVMLSAVVGAAILFLIFGAIINLLRRSQIHDIRDMHNRLTDTLNEIAGGNFNVFVETDPRAPHNEIAEALNDMARKLGTLESMRQDFISNVSHEIQSPLTSIGGFAKLLKDENLPPAQRRHYAEIIEAESRRLSGLSDHLLKLSTLDSGKIPLVRADFRLDKQLEQIALTLEPQWAAKHIRLEADLPRYTVSGDADLLSQVWINLLNNAIKFTPDGGAITITLTPKTGAVTIADTGVGIADADKMHIFERFYKADKARDRSLGGNGLGLSIVKKITELHGGSVSVTSELGRGTTFEVRLPHSGLHSV